MLKNADALDVPTQAGIRYIRDGAAGMTKMRAFGVFQQPEREQAVRMIFPNGCNMTALAGIPILTGLGAAGLKIL